MLGTQTCWQLRVRIYPSGGNCPGRPEAGERLVNNCWCGMVEFRSSGCCDFWVVLCFGPERTVAMAYTLASSFCDLKFVLKPCTQSP